MVNGKAYLLTIGIVDIVKDSRYSGIIRYHNQT